MITGKLRRYAGVRARSRNPERLVFEVRREGSRLAGVRRLRREPAAEVLSDMFLCRAGSLQHFRQTLKRSGERCLTTE